MREVGVAGASRKRAAKTTTRDQRVARAAPDLSGWRLQRRRWRSAVGGRRHLCQGVDGISVPGGGAGCLEPRVVGWSMASHLRTELVLDALNKAIWQRRPRGVVHHSDQGSQYTSIRVRGALQGG